VLKEESTPRFCKARSLPFALKEKVEDELNRMETFGIIRKVRFSDWATPIVPVLKSDKTVRICGDYKVTLNRCMEIDRYPLPKIKDLLSALQGVEEFTKLDMSQAYQQIELTEDSKLLTTINTHKGLNAYERLTYGTAASPSIFQEAMDKILSGLKGVIGYQDDMLVTGKGRGQHLQNLDAVLERLAESGVQPQQVQVLAEICQVFGARAGLKWTAN
jgi:hypothetical protein